MYIYKASPYWSSLPSDILRRVEYHEIYIYIYNFAK